VCYRHKERDKQENKVGKKKNGKRRDDGELGRKIE
jgi:hypothetical protein